jgi:molecular chaperone GrpE
MKELETKAVPRPVYAWRDGDSPDRLAVIKQEIRGLMRQLAEAKHALSEQERKHTEEARRNLLNLLEVLDAFERVSRSIHAKQDLVSPQMKIWIGNYSTVRRLLERFLSEQGITRIEILDQTFDPQWHKVADIVADSTKSDGTITEEVKKGYVWHNQVLRKAEVVVVRNAEGAAEELGG